MGNFKKMHKTCTQAANFDQGPNTTSMESLKSETVLIDSLA